MFSPNESTTDRVMRAITGAVLIGAGYFWGPGAVRIVLYVVGVVALLTAATGFCLLYRIFGISTNKTGGGRTVKHA